MCNQFVIHELKHTSTLMYKSVMLTFNFSIFEGIVTHCIDVQKWFPISFLLGFFVSGIISRWYCVFTSIPWLNGTALTVAANVDNKDEETARKIRITLMRYVNLSWVLMMRLISDQTADRFPDRQAKPVPNTSQDRHAIWRRRRKCRLHRSLYRPWSIGAIQASVVRDRTINSPSNIHRGSAGVGLRPTPSPCSQTDMEFIFDAYHAVDDQQLSKTLRAFNNDQAVQRTFGLLITENEIATFQQIANSWFRRYKTNYIPEYWIPIQWAQRLTLKALQSGYIFEPRRATYIIRELMHIRKKLHYMQLFNSIIIPLAYSQVVTIAIYSYFLCQIFATQFVAHNLEVEGGIDLYVPIFSICSFLFLMGWYKTALCVINPFGDDDEDFCISSILDYILETSYRTVYMHKATFPNGMSFLPRMRPDEESKDLENFLNQIYSEPNLVTS
ncbi:Bestrophin [Paragonimus heterotremus]|uniref:Bestrophin homolog n=1 Tax=Paragonimus heterotremus TaxID=100268 RepID=A0A8J4TSZ4_9TREM|nr:Bestrophin [Paragonimus heterotremus]